MWLSKHIISYLLVLLMVNGIQLVTAEELKSALGISLDASMPEGGVASDESSLRARPRKPTGMRKESDLVTSRILQPEQNAPEQNATGKQEMQGEPEEGTTPKQQEQSGDGGDDEEKEGGSTLIIILLVVFAFGAYMARKRMLDNSVYDGRWIVGNQDPDETDDYNVRTLNGGQEMIPLSNEDEWGWEDNARTKRDLEAGGGNGMMGKEELNSVLRTPSVSTSERTLKIDNLKRPGTISSSSGTSPKPSLVQKKAVSVPTKTTKNSSPVRARVVKQTNSWDDESDWDDDDEPSEPVSSSSVPTSTTLKKTVPPKAKKSPPLAPKPAAAAPLTVEELLAEQLKNSHAPAITSFSKPKPAASAKPRATAIKKNEEEDIFASMGLSSVPKKSNSVSSSRASHVPTQKAEQSSWKSTNLAVSAMDMSDAGSDWGNDEDLDDLLDE